MRHIRPALLALLLLPAMAAPASAKEPAEPWLTGLAFPTNMAWAPDGTLFFTEKETGNIRLVEANGQLQREPWAHVDVLGGAERGMLGVAVHPREAWVYAYYTDPQSERNHLVRFAAEGDSAGPMEVLLDGLPQAPGYHNGGDLLFGPDGMLYVSVGESHDPARAQDPDDLGGKILRLTPDGGVPEDNPFGKDNPVFSIGHRNSFGLCASRTGTIFETENGPDVNDEINVLEPGGNYGWPELTGEGGGEAFIDPILVFPEPIAITGCAVWRDGLVFGSYGESLVRRYVEGEGTSEVLAEIPGGITDVAVGPDGLLYVATSDAIWRVGSAHSPSSPAPTTLEPGTPGSTSEAPQGRAGGGGVPFGLAGAAALVLLAALAVRIRAGRRLRPG